MVDEERAGTAAVTTGESGATPPTPAPVSSKPVSSPAKIEPTKAAEPSRPALALDRFLQVAGLDAAHRPAFEVWAKNRKLKPRPIPAWRAAYAEFLKSEA